MSFSLKLPQDRVSMRTDREMTDQEFLEFCLTNKELFIEREKDGTISIMSPVTYRSGKAESKFQLYLGIWALEYGGEVFSSATGFTLPDGSVKSPDAACISDPKLSALGREEQDRFAKIVPDFVVEVRSKSDRLKQLQRKMTEAWIANGVQLAWLVDLEQQKVFVYRPDGSVSLTEGFQNQLQGESVLPGFTFDLRVLLPKQ
ncbi:MAG: Uma2 family endonuclease [Bacteroidota bacterium]